MNLVPRFIRRTWRHLGLRLGFIKPVVYTPDANLADVINSIVCSSTLTGAFIVAVETKQAMIKIMSYMEKNAIAAVGVVQGGLDIGRFPQLTLSDAVSAMRARPEHFQVVVMFKSTAAVGWRVPPEFPAYWGHIFMLSTFNPREPWKTQFNGRLRLAHWAALDKSFLDSAYGEG